MNEFCHSKYLGRIFGEYDWENILIDYLLGKLGYQLLGDGNSTQVIDGQGARQQKKLIFLSPAIAKEEGYIHAPPQYTHQ